MRITDQVKKGNLESLLDDNDRDYVFEKIKASKIKDKLIRVILDKLCSNPKEYHSISTKVFDLIYLDPKYKDDLFYLIKNNYFNLEAIDYQHLAQLLIKTKWGFDFVYDNIEIFLGGIDSFPNTVTIVEYVIENKDKFQRTLDKVLSLDNQDIKDMFIIRLLRRDKLKDLKYVLMALYKNSDDYLYEQISMFEEKKELSKSDIPNYLLSKASSSKKIDEFFKKNYEILLDTATRKFQVLESLEKNNITSEKIEKFKELYRLYKLYPPENIKEIDLLLTMLVDYGLTDYISEYIKDKEVSYMKPGSTTVPFKVGDEVIKFTIHKHESTISVPNLFLLAPTKIKIVRDQVSNLMTIEHQQFLGKEHNGSKMTKEDINNWLEELNKLGYETTDPNNLNKLFNNFGFLNDYHDANLGGVKSYEKLPEWFKERPVVLYDIDLVYKKDFENKRRYK